MVLMIKPSWFKENHHTSINQHIVDTKYINHILDVLSNDTNDTSDIINILPLTSLVSPSLAKNEMVIFLEAICESMYSSGMDINHDSDFNDTLTDNLISTIAELTNIDMIEYLKNISKEGMLSSAFDIMYLLLMMAKSPFVVHNYPNAEIRYFSSVVGEVLETFDKYDDNGSSKSFIIHKVLLDNDLSWTPDARCVQSKYDNKNAGIFKIVANFKYNGLDNNRCIRRTCTRIINKYFGM